MARKNKYETNIKPHFKAIEGYLATGHTQKSVAAQFGISLTGWERYKTKHSNFAELVQKAGMYRTALVVDATFKRAIGYEYDEITVEKTTDMKGVAKGSPGTVTQTHVKTVKKHVPANVGAQCFILCNRLPEHWRHRQELLHSGDIGTLSVLTKEEADAISKELAKKYE